MPEKKLNPECSHSMYNWIRKDDHTMVKVCSNPNCGKEIETKTVEHLHQVRK